MSTVPSQIDAWQHFWRSILPLPMRSRNTLHFASRAPIPPSASSVKHTTNMFPVIVLRAGSHDFRRMEGGTELTRIVCRSHDYSGQVDRGQLVGATQVQCETAWTRAALAGFEQTGRACVLAERHVEAAVQAVLDPTPGAHGRQAATTVGRERTDHLALPGLDPATNQSVGLPCRLGCVQPSRKTCLRL